MLQQANPNNRTRYAARRQRNHNFSAYVLLPQVHYARGNFRNEVEQRVRSNSLDCWNSQTKNQDGEQQHAAPQSGETDESSNHHADQDPEYGWFHRCGYAPAEPTGSALTPMKPCCSR